MPGKAHWVIIVTKAACLNGTIFSNNRFYNKILDRDWFYARLSQSIGTRSHVCQLQLPILIFS